MQIGVVLEILVIVVLQIVTSTNPITNMMKTTTLTSTTTMTTTIDATHTWTNMGQGAITQDFLCRYINDSKQYMTTSRYAPLSAYPSTHYDPRSLPIQGNAQGPKR